jgi:HD domain
MPATGPATSFEAGSARIEPGTTAATRHGRSSVSSDLGRPAGHDARVRIVERPDSAFARRAEELVGEFQPEFLTNHSFRSHFFAVALGEQGRIRFDVELLYVAALLHDIGLVARFDSGRCFEEDGAVEAARLAADEGWPVERCEVLGEAIRLHVAVDVELGDGPEAYLLWHSTGLDVGGHGHDELSNETVAAVLAAYPRLDFKEGFTSLIADQAARKPGCWAAAAFRSGIAERIAAAPFES